MLHDAGQSCLENLPSSNPMLAAPTKASQLNSSSYISLHSLKAVNDMVNDKNALSVNHTQLNLAESKSHSGIRAECILHMAVSIGVID